MAIFPLSFPCQILSSPPHDDDEFARSSTHDRDHYAPVAGTRRLLTPPPLPSMGEPMLVPAPRRRANTDDLSRFPTLFAAALVDSLTLDVPENPLVLSTGQLLGRTQLEGIGNAGQRNPFDRTTPIPALPLGLSVGWVCHPLTAIVDTIRERFVENAHGERPPMQRADFEHLTALLYCPVTGRLLREPRLLSDGFAYDVVAAQGALENGVSPMTGERLRGGARPVLALKALAEAVAETVAVRRLARDVVKSLRRELPADAFSPSLWRSLAVPLAGVLVGLGSWLPNLDSILPPPMPEGQIQPELLAEVLFDF